MQMESILGPNRCQLPCLATFVSFAANLLPIYTLVRNAKGCKRATNEGYLSIHIRRQLSSPHRIYFLKTLF